MGAYFLKYILHLKCVVSVMEHYILHYIIAIQHIHTYLAYDDAKNGEYMILPCFSSILVQLESLVAAVIVDPLILKLQRRRAFCYLSNVHYLIKGLIHLQVHLQEEEKWMSESRGLKRCSLATALSSPFHGTKK